MKENDVNIINVNKKNFFLLKIRSSKKSIEVFSSDSLSIWERLFSSLELSLDVLFKAKKDFY